MSNDDFIMSDLAAALSADNRANSLKDKLHNLAGEHNDVLERLSPTVRKRVEALREIQNEHDELEAKFYAEKTALESTRNFTNHCTPRFEIVNGIVDVAGDMRESTTDQEVDRSNDEIGVPDFWVTAMKTNEVLADQITGRDEEALKYLKDIKWYRIDDPKGFKLEFLFGPNPFFKNYALTKTYHVVEHDAPILNEAIGTDIEWLPGKCLTVKVLKKKPKKGSKYAKPITKTEICETFFNFFSPPEIADDDCIDEETAEVLQSQFEQDDIGKAIQDSIIPHAVSWFTGEALGDESEDIEEDEEDDNDDEDEVEDEDEDEEDDVVSKSKKKIVKAPGPRGTACRVQVKTRRAF